MGRPTASESTGESTGKSTGESTVELKVKICGITQLEQGRAISQMGATALGYICVKKSPRYVTPEAISPMTAALSKSAPALEHFGVFANAPLSEMVEATQIAGFTTIQLHGDETPAACQLLRDALERADLAGIKLVKAFRIRAVRDLEATFHYESAVDAFLLDAYHPGQLGGTGKTLDWKTLQAFSPQCPWFLAGGLTPDNILTALSQLRPNGIDLSSGVERSPGDKDLAKVRQLFAKLTPAA